MLATTANQRPGPLPYHRAIVQHLQVEEPGLWQWFTETRQRGDQAERVRLDLHIRKKANALPHTVENMVY